MPKIIKPATCFRIPPCTLSLLTRWELTLNRYCIKWQSKIDYELKQNILRNGVFHTMKTRYKTKWNLRTKKASYRPSCSANVYLKSKFLGGKKPCKSISVLFLLFFKSSVILLAWCGPLVPSIGTHTVLEFAAGLQLNSFPFPSALYTVGKLSIHPFLKVSPSMPRVSQVLCSLIGITRRTLAFTLVITLVVSSLLVITGTLLEGAASANC